MPVTLPKCEPQLLPELGHLLYKPAPRSDARSSDRDLRGFRPCGAELSPGLRVHMELLCVLVRSKAPSRFGAPERASGLSRKVRGRKMYVLRRREPTKIDLSQHLLSPLPLL